MTCGIIGQVRFCLDYSRCEDPPGCTATHKDCPDQFSRNGDGIPLEPLLRQRTCIEHCIIGGSKPLEKRFTICGGNLHAVHLSTLTQRAILRTTFWLSVGDAITLLAYAAVAVIIARTFGAAVLGTYSLAMAIAGIVQIIADAGYNIWLPRAVAQNPAVSDELVSTALSTKLLLWIVSAPGAVAIAWVHHAESAQLTMLALLDTLASCGSFTILAALRGLDRYVIPQLLSSGYSLASASAMSAVMFAGGSILAAVAAMAVVSIGRAVHLVFLYARARGGIEKIRRGTRWYRWDTIIHQLRTQRQLWVVNLASTLVHRTPLVVLGMRTGSAELGFFAAAFRIYSAARILPGALFNAVLPRLASDLQPARERNVLLFGSAVALAAGIVLFLGAEPLIGWTFQFEEAIVPMRLLAIASAGLSLKTAFEVVLISRVQDRFVAAAIAAVACATFIATWVIPAAATSFSLLLIASEWLLCIIFAGWLALQRAR
jgi:O-antigen/teichoic acid export membrane protein